METDKNILDHLELRSESVQDVLSTPPHWMIRWGNTIVLGCIIIILMMSYFIKYPEFVPASVIITSQNPPEKIVARTSSKIEKIFVENQQRVHKNMPIMVLQSSGNYRDILHLKAIMDSLPRMEIQKFPLQKVARFHLGDIQNDYNIFAKALQDELLFLQLKPYTPELNANAQNLSEIKSRMMILRQQLSLEQNKFDLVKKNFNRQELLFEQGVIPKVELENERIKYLQSEQNIKNIHLSISQLEESASNLQKGQQGIGINTQKEKISYSSQTISLYEQLRKTIKQWEQNFLILSSVDGTVSYQQFWAENQYVNSGDAILSILPYDKKSLVGRMLIPSENSGKVKIGAKVLIKLDNYRFQEYGIVEGRVQNISLTPNDKGEYFLNIILPNGLTTSFQKTLPFDKELKGDAEVVTEDVRLIERFFMQIRKLLKY
ncbi:HlyD family efflux transporter periplasmic adaptor subunit [Riemerella anatipestifer]|nr:HlyD family efflux transporter periplasmic adaptor subunit [Riemerella anatipestifer]MDY3358738.1 HlyD family efflux transporter periplasmic adaptor subunit [Riemerella anatipestifer]